MSRTEGERLGQKRFPCARRSIAEDGDPGGASVNTDQAASQPRYDPIPAIETALKIARTISLIPVPDGS
jgi:hypothetical protein